MQHPTTLAKAVEDRKIQRAENKIGVRDKISPRGLTHCLTTTDQRVKVMNRVTVNYIFVIYFSHGKICCRFSSLKYICATNTFRHFVVFKGCKRLKNID